MLTRRWNWANRCSSNGWRSGWFPIKLRKYLSTLNTQSSPLLMAAWAGLLVTGLNMMPIGQLDGGHVSFGLFGTRSTWVGLVVMALAGTYLLAYGMMNGQMHIFTVMYFLALLMGPRHPPSRDDNRSLGLATTNHWLSVAIHSNPVYTR